MVIASHCTVHDPVLSGVQMESDPSEIAVPPEERARARAILKALPEGAHEVTLTCPLCGSTAPARGLRVTPLRDLDLARWQLVFTCPACGLLTTFDAQGLSPEQIKALRGSAWATELRQFRQTTRLEIPAFVQRATTRQLIGTFVVTFITWLMLIGNFNPLEVAWGLIVSLVIAGLTYRFAAIDLPIWMLSPRRWWALALLTAEFMRQIVVQNVSLSLRVLRPRLVIRPGIVAIPTALDDDVALTLLGSLMSLTPDTVTLDIDQKRGIIYVHWIDVQTTNSVQAQRLISASLEEKIARWLD